MFLVSAGKTVEKAKQTTVTVPWQNGHCDTFLGGLF